MSAEPDIGQKMRTASILSPPVRWDRGLSPSAGRILVSATIGLAGNEAASIDFTTHFQAF